MPLIKSGSKKAVSRNISTEVRAGKPRKQAIAIALDIARRAGRKIPKRADGGDVPLWLESGLQGTPPEPSLPPKQSAEWRARRMERMGPAEPMDPEDAISMATFPIGGALGRGAWTAGKLVARAARTMPTATGLAASGAVGAGILPFASDEAEGAQRGRTPVARQSPGSEPPPPEVTGDREQDIKNRLRWIDSVEAFHATTRTPSAAGTQAQRLGSLVGEKKVLLNELTGIAADKRKAAEAKTRAETSFFDMVPGGRAIAPVAGVPLAYYGGKYLGRRLPLVGGALAGGAGGALEGAIAMGLPRKIDYETLPESSPAWQRTDRMMKEGTYQTMAGLGSLVGGGLGARGAIQGWASQLPLRGERAIPGAVPTEVATTGAGRQRSSLGPRTRASSLPSSEIEGKVVYKRPDGSYRYGNNRAPSEAIIKLLKRRGFDSGGRVLPWEGGGFAPYDDPLPWEGGGFAPRERIPLPAPRPGMRNAPMPRPRPQDLMDIGPQEEAVELRPEEAAPMPEAEASQAESQGNGFSRFLPLLVPGFAGRAARPLSRAIPAVTRAVENALERGAPAAERTIRAIHPTPRMIDPRLTRPYRDPITGQFRSRPPAMEGMQAGGAVSGNIEDRRNLALDRYRANRATRQFNIQEQANDADTRQVMRAMGDMQHGLRRAAGGSTAQQIPWTQRAAAQRLSFAGGLLKSSIPGRTDKINLNVPAGSYVVPSSVVSYLGQDNSMAGASILDSMFSSGPAGSALGSRRKFRRGQVSIKKPRMGFAEGGEVDELGMGMEESPEMEAPEMEAPEMGGAPETESDEVPIIAAGGEYIVPPEALMERFGDLETAHKIMDQFVKEARKKHIKTLQKLPGPAK